VTLNNQSYTTTVENGLWRVDVPVDDVLKLANTDYTLNVSGEDSSGNIGSTTAVFTVDTRLPVVTVNTFAGDNQVNHDEIAVNQQVSGQVSGAKAGDIVTITLADKSYSAIVQDDLTWSTDIPAEDLSALGDGPLTLIASVTTGHGNTGSGSQGIIINAQIPGLRVDTVSGDDVINTLEQQQDLVISGSSSRLPAHSVVTVHLQGKDYLATVNESGFWQVGIPASDVAALPAGRLSFEVSAVDQSGNGVALSHSITIDNNPVAVSIHAISSDNMINAVEKTENLTLSGETSGVGPGQTVVIKFAGQTYSTTVNENHQWQIEIPQAHLAGLSEGRNEAIVTVTNQVGNSGSSVQVFTVDTRPPVITIDNITDDNVLNYAESQQPLMLSGTTDAQRGQTVTLELNGKIYTTTVLEEGQWQLTVPAEDLQALSNEPLNVHASVSDIAGNPGASDHGFLVDTQVPQVTIHDFATDNVINQSEKDSAQILSGTATHAAAGDVVTIHIAGAGTFTTSIDAAGHWSIGLPAQVINGLADGDYIADVTVTDKAGNRGHQSLGFEVNTQLPGLTIASIAGDDVINALEKGDALQIGGTSDQPNGTKITVTLNGINYNAMVSENSWQLTVPAADVARLGEASYQVTATVTDINGNSNSAQHPILVDTSLPSVTINTVAGDNIINLDELNTGQIISGKVANAAEGDEVTITLGGQTFTTMVGKQLDWQINLTPDVLAAFGDGSLTVQASVSNARGNTGSRSHEFIIDAQLPGLRIDTVSGDDIINLAEHNQDLIVSGTSSKLSADSVVTVVIEGKTYLATVKADGSWSAAIPASDVSQFTDGVLTITASAEDSAHNPVLIHKEIAVSLSPVSISIDPITDDNVVNSTEKNSDIVLSGQTTHVEPGQNVTITFAGQTYTTRVNDEGRWQYTVPAENLTELRDGVWQVSVSVSTVSGNPASPRKLKRQNPRSWSPMIRVTVKVCWQTMRSLMTTRRHSTGRDSQGHPFKLKMPRVIPLPAPWSAQTVNGRFHSVNRLMAIILIALCKSAAIKRFQQVR